MRKHFIQNEPAQAVAAIIMLVITGILYAGFLHHEHVLNEELKAAGISIEDMIRGR